MNAPHGSAPCGAFWRFPPPTTYPAQPHRRVIGVTVFKPLHNALVAFEMARDTYIEASKARDAETAIEALVQGMQAADSILTFLGHIEPYECGNCESCTANAETRRADMQAAVDADPELSPSGPLGMHLSPEEEASVRKLLDEAFGEEDK